MNNKNQNIQVNVCWELAKHRECKTMSKEEAYNLKNWLDENQGFCYWFQALDS